MKNFFAVLLASGLALASSASAQDSSGGFLNTITPDFAYEGPSERVKLGYGRLVNNDLIGELRDRWQTASFSSSRVMGYDWSGNLPQDFGQLLEYRMQTKIIAPGDVENPVPNDRLYSTSVSLGAHTHFSVGPGEVSVGGDVVITGPMTGLSDLQHFVHDLIDRDVPSAATKADMIPNGFHPGLVFEYGHPLQLSSTTELRPFAELRTGDETLIRSGVDLYIGGVAENDLLIREQVTGQRYSAVQGDQLPGYGIIVGGDIAAMGQSIYLPDRGPTMIDNRTRLRAGVMWQGQQNSVFYGMTWLSREFETQEESQFVGSIRLNFEF